MPIYEFRCEGCQAVFEHLALSQGETLDLRCPSCGGESLSRVMSACSSVVSGGGAAAPAAGSCMQSRSCAGAGNCATFTLPGGD
jgi:putative FmdB family regulatory protein